MIVVTGWPRSGTSLLMQMLAAGGLDPIVGPNATAPRPGNPGGVWEMPFATRNPARAVRGRQRDPRAAIKLFYQPLRALTLRGGVPPAGVIRTDREPAAARASQEARGMGAISATDLAGIRADALAALDAAGIPQHIVPLELLVRKPLESAAHLAAFLRPLVGDVDLEAMAAIPDPDLIHF